MKNLNINKIAIPSSSGYVFCFCKEIIYCKSDGNYTSIYFFTGKIITASKTLKKVEEILNLYPFYRVHQSYLINLNYIAEYIKSLGGYVVMDNGVEIPVARNRKKQFLEMINLVLIK